MGRRRQHGSMRTCSPSQATLALIRASNDTEHEQRAQFPSDLEKIGAALNPALTLASSSRSIVRQGSWQPDSWKGWGCAPAPKPPPLQSDCKAKPPSRNLVLVP